MRKGEFVQSIVIILAILIIPSAYCFVEFRDLLLGSQQSTVSGKVAAEPRSASFLKSSNRSLDLLIQENNTPKGVFLQPVASDQQLSTKKVRSSEFSVSNKKSELISRTTKLETRNSKPETDKLLAKTAKLQMPFIENQGQIKDKSVKFYANTFAGNVYVTEKEEVVYALQGLSSKGQGSKVAAEPRSAFKPEIRNPKLETNSEQLATKFAILKETLVGAKETGVKGKDSAVTKVNYFVGDKKDWKNNIPSYNEVNFGEVYNGIELTLKAYGKNIEKLFTINPKGKVDDIKVNIDGAKDLSINKSGELEVVTELGSVKFTKPYAYQEIYGKRVEVKCEFQVSSLKSQVQNLKLNTPNIPTYSYRFKVASYNPNYPLIIDPALATTFIGSSGEENSKSIAIDGGGNIFVAGYTNSTNYPITQGIYDTSYNGSNDVIVSKLDNNLTSLLSSTFIGGSSNDYGYSLAIDSGGNIFVTGFTTSSNYPVTSGAYDTSHNGSNDVFVSKLDNNLTSLLSSTFIGGSSNDYGYSLAIDSGGNVFVTGFTTSSDYPVTSGAYDTSHNGSNDVFVSKLDNNLTSLLSSTFIGGSSNDYSESIILDSNGNVFVTGFTVSSNYPTTLGAYDTSYNGDNDVFVSKLNNNLTSLLSSTFLGGSGRDRGYAIASSPDGNVFVTGFTWSSNYPTTFGAYDTSINGYDDVFISKLNNNLTSLLSSTFIGGGG